MTAERGKREGLQSHDALLTAEPAGRLPEQPENEARLRFAAQAGRLGIWELDLRTGQLTASSECKENFGRNRSDPFTYEELKAAIYPDDRERMRAAVEHSTATGADFDIEYRVTRPDGAIAWLQVRAQLVRAKGGTPLRMAGISLDTTERRTAELRLELSEQSLRLATDAAEVGTWDLDLATDVLTWSDRTKAMFGISPDVLCSMEDFYAGLHPEDREATGAAFASALHPGIRTTYDVEYRTIGKEDGLVRWVAAKGKGLFDEHGRCIRAIGTAIDITGRKAAEQRLRASEATLAESEAKFRAITDSVDQMIWSTRPDGFHDFYNQRWYDYTGVSQGSTDGEGWSGMFHPDDQERAWTGWRHSLATGEPYGIEYRLRHRSGVYRWVLGRAVPLRDDRGRIIRWFGTCTDIQEIVEAREVLARSRDELEREVAERTRERDRVWQNSRDLLVVVGKDGIFRAVNPAWTAILGHKPAEVAGRSFLDFIWPDDAELTQGGLDAAASRGDLTNFENRYSHQDGTARWISWHTSAEGDVVYAYGRHVTAEKEAAARLEAAQEQLRQAQKMEAVGQLTGGVAHDFNNLLQIVVGNLEILQRGLLPEDAGRLRRSADNAMTGAKRAATLTQRLLAFSRRQPLAPKPVDANALMSGMSDLLSRALGETIELETVLAGGLWRTEADPNQLESAILNLAVNARDAMPNGGKLTVETVNARLDEAYAQSNLEVRPGQYVVISVSDTGSGMDRATMARVFEPFFTTKQVGKGTGLGLAMVYGFIKQSGGHVKLYSEPGQGTTVKIYLPRLARSVEEDKPVPVSAIPEASPTETILVVEDDDDVRAYSVEVLRELGYRVLEASDGPSALAALERPGAFDVRLLFTDIVLPGGLSGADLARTATALRPGLKVLFTTGYARNAIVHQGRLEEEVELITKPFTYADLAAKVRDVLDLASAT